MVETSDQNAPKSHCNCGCGSTEKRTHNITEKETPSWGRGQPHQPAQPGVLDPDPVSQVPLMPVPLSINICFTVKPHAKRLPLGTSVTLQWMALSVFYATFSLGCDTQLTSFSVIHVFRQHIPMESLLFLSHCTGKVSKTDKASDLVELFQPSSQTTNSVNSVNPARQC